METSEREKIYALLDEIRTLLKENEQEDGTFRFDPVRALIALDFAKTEIARTIDETKLVTVQTTLCISTTGTPVK